MPRSLMAPLDQGAATVSKKRFDSNSLPLGTHHSLRMLHNQHDDEFLTYSPSSDTRYAADPSTRFHPGTSEIAKTTLPHVKRGPNEHITLHQAFRYAAFDRRG